jgi:hypothetical protein
MGRLAPLPSAVSWGKRPGGIPGRKQPGPGRFATGSGSLSPRATTACAPVTPSRYPEMFGLLRRSFRGSGMQVVPPYASPRLLVP